MPLNDTALYHLINIGVRDMDAIDKPWDASTCSMRYTACLGDRLWTMLIREQNRVCVFCFFVLFKKLNMLSRMIVWKLESASWRRARLPK